MYIYIYMYIYIHVYIHIYIYIYIERVVGNSYVLALCPVVICPCLCTADNYIGRAPEAQQAFSAPREISHTPRPAQGSLSYLNII